VKDNVPPTMASLKITLRLNSEPLKFKDFAKFE
jgi:hypothetical protein